MKCNQLINQIDEFIQQNEEALLLDLVRLINIKSVSKPDGSEFPFGIGCKKIIDEVDLILNKYNLESNNDEYLYLTSSIRGKSKKEIGIFTHLDIVPEGDINQWSCSPYDAIIKDGYVFGRGSRDNKGAAIVAIYVLRFFNENKLIKLKNNIKVFFGCNEENGMADISIFLKRNNIPEFSLVPDGDFPVSVAEMGIVVFTVEIDISDGNLQDLFAGDASSIIPSYARACIKNTTINDQIYKECNKKSIKVEQYSDGLIIEAQGISKHAAYPKGSINAIKRLTSFMVDQDLLSGSAKNAIFFINHTLDDFQGHSINIPFDENIFGSTIHAGCMTRINEGILSITYSVRYPPNINENCIEGKLREFFSEAGFKISNYRNNLGSKIDLQDLILEELAGISDEQTGCGLSPYVMIGGTYARKIPNAIAYGLSVPGKDKLFSSDKGDGHQPDECVSITQLKNGLKVYIQAIMKIDEYLS